MDNFLPPKNFRSFFFTTKDKTKLRVAIWNEESKKGTIVLQSGRGEFIEKYYEIVEDLINLGFCVAMFDWRGQGLSDRLTSNHYVGYVNTFADYENDLLEILGKVYRGLPKPWIGMGHSMGGCIVLSSLINCSIRDTAPIAIKNSPCVTDFSTLIPLFLATFSHARKSMSAVMSTKPGSLST